MIVKITIESDSDQDDFYYEKELTEEEFEDVKANIEVMMDKFDDLPEDEEDEEDEEDGEDGSDESVEEHPHTHTLNDILVPALQDHSEEIKKEDSNG